MSENVVTTDWVRENYALVVDEGQPVDYRALREFDAWYESEKRKWQAEILREVADEVVKFGIPGTGAVSVHDREIAIKNWLRTRANYIDENGDTQ